MRLGILMNNIKKRVNWKSKYRKAKEEAVSEVVEYAIQELRGKIRSVPKEWHRGYFSAISTLEMMIDKS